MLRLEYKPYRLHFKFPARTSRGLMKHRRVWFLKVYDNRYPHTFGLGEAAPIDDLSREDAALMTPAFDEVVRNIEKTPMPADTEQACQFARQLSPRGFNSIRFGLETALIDLLNGGRRVLFDNGFVRGEFNIKINGLIWMGDEGYMKQQIDEKLKEGYGCIKMKIGAIEFDKELSLLGYLRGRSSDIMLRVDANGALENRRSLSRLKQLAELDIHSIEQPVMPSQRETMQLLCTRGAVKVALDEELIGVNDMKEKATLLDFIKPAFIVLKPSLLGGFSATDEWIRLAEERRIGWWITSALESNVGLNAISQFASQYSNSLHHGLGTGQLYHNNIDSPLSVHGGVIGSSPQKRWGFIPM